MLRSLEQSVTAFTNRLLHLKNIEGQPVMPVEEALQWAKEIKQALDTAHRLDERVRDSL
jgi:hypothetical protein